MRPSLLLALILLDFGWGATGQKRFVFCIPCYILNLELLIPVRRVRRIREDRFQYKLIPQSQLDEHQYPYRLHPKKEIEQKT